VLDQLMTDVDGLVAERKKLTASIDDLRQKIEFSEREIEHSRSVEQFWLHEAEQLLTIGASVGLDDEAGRAVDVREPQQVIAHVEGTFARLLDQLREANAQYQALVEQKAEVAGGGGAASSTGSAVAGRAGGAGEGRRAGEGDGCEAGQAGGCAGTAGQGHGARGVPARPAGARAAALRRRRRGDAAGGRGRGRVVCGAAGRTPARAEGAESAA